MQQDRTAHGEKDPHGIKGAAAGLVPVGLLLVAGGILALLGQADDLYLYGLIPARWILIVGLVMGVAIIAIVVAAVGGSGSALAVGAWFRRWKRLWIGLGIAALTIGGIGTWEAYAAPQEVIIEGAPNAPVQVRIAGSEPFDHTIEPGSRLEFAVPHGEHLITLTCEGRKAEHSLRHAGFRGEPRIISAP